MSHRQPIQQAQKSSRVPHRQASEQSRERLSGTVASADSLTGRTHIDPRHLSAGDVLALQRCVGNYAVAQMLGRVGPQSKLSRVSVQVQPKLALDSVGGRFEQEADRTANQVTEKPSLPIMQQGTATAPMIQLKRYDAGDVIKFTLNPDEEEEHNGFVIKVKTDSDNDDLVVYEVDAHIEGINKSLLVRGGVAIAEEHAPVIAGINDEVNRIFDEEDDRLRTLIGLPVTFVTDDNIEDLTRFGQVEVGDVLVGEGILIKCPDNNKLSFLRGVIRDLITISKTKSGKALLFSINAAATAQGNAKPNAPNILTKISRIAGASQVANPAQQWQGDQPDSPINPEVAYQPGYSGVLVADRMRLLQQNVINNPHMSDDQRRGFLEAVTDPLTAGWGRAKDKPSDVTLFHELIHAEDMMHGRLHKETARRGGQTPEVAEMRAVGLEEYYDEDFIAGRTNRPLVYSENTYRHERGVAPRAFYSNPDEGNLAPLAQVPQQPLNAVPALMPVPTKYKGPNWLRHKITPGDTKIGARQQAITAALAHNQNVQQIIQGNNAITAENTKAASRNALLAHVKQTGQQANQAAINYEQSLLRPPAKKATKKKVSAKLPAKKLAKKKTTSKKAVSKSKKKKKEKEKVLAL